MKKIGVMLMVLVFAVLSLKANTDVRQWTMAWGERFSAELVKYDKESDKAELRLPGGDVKTYTKKEFAAVDAAWLVQWAEFSEELDLVMKDVNGQFNHYQFHGEFATDYYVYTPESYYGNKSLPMLILFHPGGKGARYVKRFIQVAEELDLIVVSSDAFRNTGAVWNEKDDRMLKIFKELLPELDEVIRYDKEQLYMGGSSGGAQRAYHFSSMIDRPWAGIWANGGWIGGREYYTMPFPGEMKIAMVNGQRDGANRWIKPDSEVFQEAGNVVKVFSFDGGHQVPPPMIQFKSLDWLIHQENGE